MLDFLCKKSSIGYTHIIYRKRFILGLICSFCYFINIKRISHNFSNILDFSFDYQCVTNGHIHYSRFLIFGFNVTLDTENSKLIVNRNNRDIFSATINDI